MKYIVIGAALEEELLGILEYCSMYYTINTVLEKKILALGIQDFTDINAKNIQRASYHCQGFSQYTNKDIAYTKCRAYTISDTHTCLIFKTGIGINQVYLAYNTLQTVVDIDSVYFVGCGLGISPELHKGNMIYVQHALDYDDTDNSTIDIQLQKYIEYNRTKTLPLQGIALTGNTYINIRKRKNIISHNSENDTILALLPDTAKNKVSYIQSFCDMHRVYIPIVLDMESTAILQLSIQGTIHIVRIVLDTIYDTQPINFREDIKNIALSLTQYMIPIVSSL